MLDYSARALNAHPPPRPSLLSLGSQPAILLKPLSEFFHDRVLGHRDRDAILYRRTQLSFRRNSLSRCSFCAYQLLFVDLHLV